MPIPWEELFPWYSVDAPAMALAMRIVFPDATRCAFYRVGEIVTFGCDVLVCEDESAYQAARLSSTLENTNIVTQAWLIHKAMDVTHGGGRWVSKCEAA